MKHVILQSIWLLNSAEHTVNPPHVEVYQGVNIFMWGSLPDYLSDQITQFEISYTEYNYEHGAEPDQRTSLPSDLCLHCSQIIIIIVCVLKGLWHQSWVYPVCQGIFQHCIFTVYAQLLKFKAQLLKWHWFQTFNTTINKN